VSAQAVGLLRLLHEPIALRKRVVEVTARGRRLLGLPAATVESHFKPTGVAA
jgi:hypothetical protein